MSDIEVLEPYPNEVLYSWLSRMFYWYGLRNNPRSNICRFNMLLFGINSRSINNILIPHDLNNLIKNINLPDSKYFSSTTSLIEQTTIMPFYLAFLKETEKKQVLNSLIENGPLNITKSILGLKDLHSISNDYKLKFCYQCWLDSKNIYFDLEHQIKDNLICYTHNTRLQYIVIDSNEYFFPDKTCFDRLIDSPYCINKNDSFISCFSEIAIIIHEIIINGFKDDIVRLKAKIRMKLLCMGYMRSDFNFIERFDELWLCYSKYNVLGIDKKEFINALYTTTQNPNPVLYVTLIIYLFGSLKLYYEYKIDEQNIVVIKQKFSKVISLTQQLKPSGLIFYDDLIHKVYKDHYSILTKCDNKHYEIKCNLCNYTWIIPQYYIRGEMIRCHNCEKKGG